MSKIRFIMKKTIIFLFAIPFALEILIKLGVYPGVDYSQMQSYTIAYNTLSFLFSIVNFILLYAWLFYLVMDMLYIITSIYFPSVIEELLEKPYFNLKPFISKRAKDCANIRLTDALKLILVKVFSYLSYFYSFST